MYPCSLLVSVCTKWTPLILAISCPLEVSPCHSYHNYWSWIFLTSISQFNSLFWGLPVECWLFRDVVLLLLLDDVVTAVLLLLVGCAASDTAWTAAFMASMAPWMIVFVISHAFSFFFPILLSFFCESTVLGLLVCVCLAGTAFY